MGPLEVIRVIGFVLSVLKSAIELWKEHKKLGRDLELGLDKLTKALDNLQNGLKNERWEGYNELQVTELVYNIEDFAQSLCTPGASAPLRLAIGTDPRKEYVDRIKAFHDEVDKLLTQQRKSPESRPQQCGGSNSDPASSSAAGGYTSEESLVGITQPKGTILDLLENRRHHRAGGQDAKKPPMVISIVGCPGVGKTALARVVYDHYVTCRDTCASDEFECVAWVEAAGCNDKTALLAKILQQVEADLASRASLTILLAKILQKIKANLVNRASLTALVGKIHQNVTSRASLIALVRKILSKVVFSDGDGNTASSPQLGGILADKRYLVFIDDVQQANVLKDIIHDHFPENAKSGMVIVTTSVRQVADVCSPGSYVYTMKCLDKKESEKLFCRQAFNKKREDVGSANLADLRSIITKFGRLPLALVSAAEHLRLNATKVDSSFCDNVVKELGSYVASSNTMEEFLQLRRVLGQCYQAVPDYDYKNYMRSLSIFPRNYPINCKSLVRRLAAEGLVYGGGRKCLDELINRCIVEAAQISSYSKNVKSCRVNVGLMLEFIIQKSLSTNFVTVIQEEEVVRAPNGKIRRLSVHSSTKYEFKEVERENKTIRSLTIIPAEGRRERDPLEINSYKTKLSEIKSCKFLRVLDLEGCMELDEEFFNDICDLVYLKYLSLRRTDVKKIPNQIKKLLCLQTLDIRETRKMDLPEEVITLPELAFLFGLFVLPKISKKTKDFLSGKSKLHTVAEFVVDQWKGSERIILEAKNLKKVKVRCTYTSNNDFTLSLRNCFSSLESLSIQSGQLSPDIMASLDADTPLPNKRYCIIKRLKLWGKLESLPGIPTLGMIDTLNKLQLSYTGLTSEALSTLQHITRLQYLKLHDNENSSWDGIFHVLEGGFESLLLLCFQAPKLPKLKFDTGSVQSLTSLHLLCPDTSQMQEVGEISESIGHITSLNEVIFHGSAPAGIVEAWKTAAKSNPSWPRVLSYKKNNHSVKTSDRQHM